MKFCPLLWLRASHYSKGYYFLRVLGLLKLSVETYRQTLVMITHNLELAQMADRVVRIEDGRIRA